MEGKNKVEGVVLLNLNLRKLQQSKQYGIQSSGKEVFVFAFFTTVSDFNKTPCNLLKKVDISNNDL